MEEVAKQLTKPKRVTKPKVVKIVEETTEPKRGLVEVVEKVKKVPKPKKERTPEKIEEDKLRMSKLRSLKKPKEKI